ncbi:hypothetical protein AXF42_Ash004783 [Apostasia shenzhenica]|uniref:Importin-9 n=1 Tax=Apostasia shenzhenica TaxID=1088818 RepID=A0A2I0BHN4_9ASPA|nr:hypothetical protein AXF42_Ash004783 [Apostasia shenzhenica]
MNGALGWRCLLQLVQHFPSLVDTQFSVVLTPLWKTFVTSLDAYQISSVRGIEDSHSGRFDSDGNERSLDTFVMQMFETLLTVIGNSRLQKVIRESIKEVAYYTIGFLQITDEQVHVWSLDANQYVADEDDVTYSCRVSGSLLLEEIANAFGSEGINAIVEAARKHLTESHHAKVSGFADWWRLREASLFALVSISDQLIEVDDSRFSKSNFGYLLEQIIAEDMETDAHKFPFLHSRAFSAISKFSSVISHTVCEQLLCAAVRAIDLDVSQPVKVGACQALLQLLPDAKLEIVQPHIMRVLSSLIVLLKQASDETLHLFLETIQVVVKAGHEQSRCIEAVISPVILDVWLHYVSDPFISIDALEVLEAIKNSPGCLHTIVSRIVPSVGLVLGTAKNQPSGLVAGSLDLLTMILKGAPLDVVKAVFDCCFNSAIQVLLESDDHGEMQNATECLAVFLASGRHELLSWTGDPSFTMKMLLDAASRLLDPNLECSGSLFVGSYILQLILHFPSEMAFHIREVVAAVIRRLRSCEISGLKSSLILIIARLVHLSSSDVNQFISLLLTLPTDGHKNALSYVMSEWTKVQGEIQGAYQIKVTTIALALLLSTHHEELAKINVEGHLIESNTGITTRSKAKLAPEQWTTVSVPEKIFSLLCDTLVEIQEQVMDDNDDDDEDSDWEEVSESNGSVVHNLLYQSTAPSKSGPAVEHLDAMAKVFSECGDNTSEDEFAQADPLNEVLRCPFPPLVIFHDIC